VGSAAYCHGGDRPQQTIVTRRKDLARKMIMMVRQIFANFRGRESFP
jgi:hypothetical protein